MRIAIVAPPWIEIPPRKYGGTERYLDTLATGLRKAGHDVVLFTISSSTCEVPRVGTLAPDPTKLLWSARELEHVLRSYALIQRSDQPFDVILDNTELGPQLAHQYVATPVVTPRHIGTQLTNGVTEASLAAMCTSIFLSPTQKASTPAWARNPLDTVVPHGLDLDKYPFFRQPGTHPDIPAPDGDSAPYLAYIGRMTPGKGSGDAISIVLRHNQLARKHGHQPMRLLLAGRLSNTDGEPEYYEHKVKPLLGEGIEYVGEVTDAEKFALLGNATGFVNYVRWNEPFGLTMIEAMACGVPLIVSESGSSRWLVTDRVHGFRCRSIEQAALAVPRLHEIDRAELRRYVADNFSAAEMVQKTTDVLEGAHDRGPLPSFVKADPIRLPPATLSGFSLVGETGLTLR